MAIIEIITDPWHFATWIRNSDNYSNNFTLDGANALQAHLDDLSDELDTPIEFDPIGWCSEFSEYDTAWDAMEQYQPDDMPVEGVEGDDLLEIQDKNNAAALEWLQYNTTVIEIDGTDRVIIRDF